MIGHEGKEYGFDRLFDAVRYTPENVPKMINDEPELLDCKSYAGETVLNWFSLEGNNEIVSLLLSCGAIPDEWSLYYAIELAHLDTVSLLMEHGCKPTQSLLEQVTKRANLKPNDKKILVRIFHSHGYKI